ncbi:hypothetical protein ACFVSW_12570 [Neobacillus sp. NPDC058068]|uniref:hypothetical protein n=1 Tax=Neobacillus sp. NPDC058068 TaxID=3346325 RepID=UPI0036D8A152
MKIKVRNFPHPVLNPVSDDFRAGSFKGKIVTQNEEDYFLEFTVNFELDNEKLKELIETNMAKYYVHFECVTTMQRITRSGSASTFKIEIPKNDLNKKIDVNFFILAEEKIENYTNVDAHVDFQGINFKIQKGDILAYSESQTIHIEKQPMSNTNSIFKVSKNTSSNAPAIRISLFDHQIDITLPEVSYSKIANLKAFGKDCNDVLISMLYIPALIDTLYNVQTIAKDDEYLLEEIESLDWFRTLEKKLKNLGYNITDIKSEDITSISYELLNSSKDASWVALENIVYREDDENDNL